MFTLENPGITQLNSEGLDSVIKDKEALFSSLRHIYLKGCSIKFVEADALKLFKKLEIIDLSSNLLLSLNGQVGLALNGGVMLKLKDNP